jgi:hypothetical protein
MLSGRRPEKGLPIQIAKKWESRSALFAAPETLVAGVRILNAPSPSHS